MPKQKKNDPFDNMPLTPLKEKYEGMIRPPTAEVFDRPKMYNLDGSISTMRTVGVGGPNGQQAIIPSVVDGERLPIRQAIDYSRNTGKHLGVFKSQADAEAFDKDIHAREAADRKLRKWGSTQPGSYAEILQRLTGDF